MKSSPQSITHDEDQDDSSDDDSAVPQPARKKSKIDVKQLTSELKSVKETLTNILTKHSITQGWRQVLNEHFKCQICQGIINPPILVSECCHTILGCQDCISRWYEEASGCPTCRAEDNNATIVLRGLNDLLEKIRLLNQDDV